MQPGDRYIIEKKFQQALTEEMARWSGLMERLSAYDGPPREPEA